MFALTVLLFFSQNNFPYSEAPLFNGIFLPALNVKYFVYWVTCFFNIFKVRCCNCRPFSIFHFNKEYNDSIKNKNLIKRSSPCLRYMLPAWAPVVLIFHFFPCLVGRQFHQSPWVAYFDDYNQGELTTEFIKTFV